MKILYSKLLLVVFITNLFLSSVGVMVAQATDQTLFTIDQNMTINGILLDGSGYEIFNNVWNYTGTPFVRSLANNADYYVISQTKSSRDNNRLVFADPGKYAGLNFTLDKKLTFETKFKVETASTANSIRAMIRFITGTVAGTTADQAIPFGSTWHIMKYYVDPTAKTVVTELDGTTIATNNFTATPPTAASFQMGNVVQISDGAGGYVADNVDLGTTVTWTYDYFKVTGEVVQTPPAGERVDLLTIDDNMTSVLNTSTWNRDMKQVNSTRTDWIEHAYYPSGIVSSVTANSVFNVTQSKATQYQQRFYFRAPSDYSMTKPTVFETKFKLNVGAYVNPSDPMNATPKIQFAFVVAGLDIAWSTVAMPSNSVLPSDGNWHIMKYIVDPTTKKVTVNLDDVLLNTVSFGANASTTSFNGVRIDAVVTNVNGNHTGDVGSGTTVLTDGYLLDAPVTWAYDYFKAYNPGTDPVPTATPTPTPVPTPVDISSNGFLIDEFTMANSTAGRKLSQTSKVGTNDVESIIEHIDYVGSVASISTDGKKNFIINQSKGSFYNSRLMFLNATANSPVNNKIKLDMTKPFAIEMKFKVASSKYSQDIRPRFMFSTAPGTECYMEMGDYIPVSAATQNTWQIMKYTYDPATETIIGELDGKLVARSNIRKTALTQIMLQMITATQNLEKDGVDLGATLTWTFDYFKITNTNAPAPVIRDSITIDNSMSFTNNTLSQDGSIVYDNSSSAAVASVSGSNFIIDQTKSSSVNQKLTLQGIFKKDVPTVFETKFKLAVPAGSAAGQTPAASINLDATSLGAGYQNISLAPLTEAGNNTWHTLRYTINPITGIITYRLDNAQDVQLCSFDLGAALGTFSIGIYPNLQNQGETNKDGTALNVPATWTFDYFTVSQDHSLIPLATPVSAANWSTLSYPNGTGRDVGPQLQELILPLGTFADINKIEIEHDTSKIMSFTLYTSNDGLNYTAVTDTYPGETNRYSGKQVYRFAPQKARFVKYKAVLLGEYETLAMLSSITASYANTTAIKFSDVPSVVNSLDTKEVLLHSTLTDTVEFPAVRAGVTYTINGNAPSGVTINGNILSIPKEASGSVSVTATDVSNGISTTKNISVKPLVSVHNLGLYSDNSYQTPITDITSGKTVYAKAEILASSAVANKNVSLIMASYDANGKLLNVSIQNQTAGTTGSYQPINTAVNIAGNATRVSAFIWNYDTQAVCSPMASYTNNGSAKGISSQNINILKSNKVTLSATGGAVTWTSSNPDIATVTSAGVVEGKGEGKAVITAKIGENVIGNTTVNVEVTGYLFLLMGQSNMTGTNSPSVEGLTLPISSNVQLFNGTNFVAATQPYRQYTGVKYDNGGNDSRVGVGINAGYSFSEELAKMYPDKKIDLIVNSAAGQSIKLWEKGTLNTAGTPNNGFTDSIAKVVAATAGTVELKGIIWHQGENDQATSLNYAHRIRNLAYSFRKELNLPTVTFIAGGLSETYDRATYRMNSIFELNEQNAPYFGFASSTNPDKIITQKDMVTLYPSGDFTHFSATGQIEFGKRYFQKYLQIQDMKKD